VQTLIHAVFDLAERRPDDVAYRFLTEGDADGPVEELTYAQLLARAQCLGHFLEQRGGRGQRALMLYPQGLEFLSAFVGCLASGVVAVPAHAPSTGYPVRMLERLRSIATDAGARFVLTTREALAAIEERLPAVPQLAELTWVATDELSGTTGAGLTAPAVRPGDLAFLQYTSGSTSTPKGVCVTHENLMHNARLVQRVTGFGPGDVTVSWTPLYHDLGLICMALTSLIMGVPATLMSPLSFVKKPVRWLRALTALGGTFTSGPNFAYDLCLRRISAREREGLDLSALRIAINGAEPVRAETMEQFVEVFGPHGLRRDALAPAYGLAESTVYACSRSRYDGGLRHLSVSRSALERNRIEAATGEGSQMLAGCGQVLAESDDADAQVVRIVDPHTRKRCGSGEVGEIWLSSRSVAQGYWNRPEVSEEIFRATLADVDDGRRYLRTGDLGCVIDGEIYITGRIKELIIIDGANHYPQDIERTVTGCDPLLRDSLCVTFSVPHGAEERVVIVQEIHGQKLRTTSAEQLLDAIRSAVTTVHEIPIQAILLVRERTITKTTSGKLQRTDGRRRYLAGELEPLASWGVIPAARQAPAEGPADEHESQARPAGEPRAAASITSASVLDWLVRHIADRLSIPAKDVDPNQRLVSYGLGSRQFVELAAELEAEIGRPISTVAAFDHPTLAALAAHVAGTAEPTGSVAGRPHRSPATHRRAGAGERAPEPIAVIGMSCRVPGAEDLDAFVRLLDDGIDAVTPVPSSRWDADALFAPEPTPGKICSRFMGSLRDVEMFDAEFFGISPREARLMDPQQRLFLEVAWEALEHAGIAANTLAGTSTGVYVGVTTSDYGHRQFADATEIDAYTGTGSAHCIVANRLSYLLGLQGPSMAIDTACSSSLVAVHQACQSLNDRECDLALAGGVNLILSPHMSVALSQAGMLSVHGRCKAFDQDAAGYVRGEGCGAIVLKRLSDAQRDGDRIVGVILGSAVNQDGASNGLTAPSGLAQEALVRSALERAGVEPTDVGYFEAHGTGTPLGDPIEVEALARVFSSGPPLTIGSVKSNIGHLESAAGIAGMIKALLVVQRGMIPAHLHFRRFNPRVAEAARKRVHIPVRLETWSRPGKRIAGVSSFGFGGTNVHVVVSEPPAPEVASEVASQVAPAPRPGALCLSARSHSALRTLAGRYAAWIDAHPDADPEALCSTAHGGRVRQKVRWSTVFSDTPELHTRLVAVAAGRADSEMVTASSRPPRIALLFSGAGTQYGGMGHERFSTDDTYRDAVTKCARIFDPLLGASLLEIMHADGDARLHTPLLAQCALFAQAYGLSACLQRWGVKPELVLGHSGGEITAACVAGALDVEDAARLLVHRGRLIETTSPRGTMLVALAPESAVVELLAATGTRVAIAALNGPHSTALSGDRDELSVVRAALGRAKIECRELQVLCAFHSPLMDPILDDLERIAATLQTRPLALALASGVTGAVIAPGTRLDARHWRELTREPVRFDSAVRAAVAHGVNVFIDVGPHPVLLSLARSNVAQDQDVTWIASMRRNRSDAEMRARSLADLVQRGVELDWAMVHGHRARLDLPLSSFERKRYWLEGGARPVRPEVIAAGEVAPRPVLEHAPAYERTSTAAPASPAARTNESILTFVRTQIAQALELAPDQVAENVSLLELGADSLALLRAVQRIEHHFQIHIPMRRFFEDLHTVSEVAGFVAAHSPVAAPAALPEAPAQSAPQVQQDSHPAGTRAAPAASIATNPAGAATNVGAVERLLQSQLDIMAQQLEVLRAYSVGAAHTPAMQATSVLAPEPPRARQAPGAASTSSPLASAPAQMRQNPFSPPAQRHDANALPAHKQAYFDAFAARYLARTRRSREVTQANREVLADFRASVGFRPSIKELLFPLTADRSEGAHFWDLDGNQYIDLTMGFGVHLLGHRPPFVEKALHEQLERGMELGPRSPLAGEAAHLISELTGMERVAFCTSGTEAVMVAVRIARAATSRSRIAVFNGSYHGQSDITLVTPEPGGTSTRAVPMAAGIPESTAGEVVILEYGQDSALEAIRAMGDQLAAVLVEPVQSRRPELQPGAFLRELREITRATGTALIFDEMITGFRIHPGGAQAHFGVRGDIATYGKAVGAGLPIGVVAGSPAFMDRIDGGVWQYGDRSFPRTATTFLASTFTMQPLAMAAARAVLRHLREQGPGLQQAANARAERMYQRLDQCFADAGVDISVARFGTLFRFSFRQNLDLFFYHLLLKGIYIWEGRNCFLSTAHTDADLDRVVDAVRETLSEMQAGGFLEPRTPRRDRVVPTAASAIDRGDTGEKSPTPGAVTQAPEARHQPFPLTEFQEAYWLGERGFFDLGGLRPHAYFEFDVHELDPDRLETAIRALIARHDMLRATVDSEGQWQVMPEAPPWSLPHEDLSNQALGAQEQLLAQVRRTMTDNGPAADQWPLFEVRAHRLDVRRWRVFVSLHLLIVDQGSGLVITRELAQLLADPGARLEPLTVTFRDMVLAAKASESSERFVKAEAWWRKRLLDLPEAPRLHMAVRPDALDRPRFHHRAVHFEAGAWARLCARARSRGVTPAASMCAVFCEALATWAEEPRFLLNMLVADRPPFHPQVDALIGNFNSTVLLDVDLPPGSFTERARALQANLHDVLEHAAFSGVRVLRERNRLRGGGTEAGAPIVFVWDLPSSSSDTKLWGPWLDRLYTTVQTTHVSLESQIQPAPSGGVNVIVDAIDDLFPRGMVDALFAAYVRLVRDLSAEEGDEAWSRPVGALAPSGDLALVAAANATSAPLPSGLLDERFETMARRHPERVAVICGDVRLSYGELDRLSARLARSLQERGVKPDQLVGVEIERGWQQVVAVLGILRSGAAYLPIDPALPAERREWLLEHCEGRLCVTRVDDLSDDQGSSRASVLGTPARPGDLAYVIFTSGSTGEPKGVAIEHRSCLNTIMDINQRWSVGPEDRVLALSSLSFDLSVYDIFGPLSVGGAVVIPLPDQTRDPAAWMRLCQDARVTVWNSVPALMGMAVQWLRDQRLELPSSLRLVLLSGDWIPTPLPGELRQLGKGLEVVSLGGATEASIWSIAYPIHEVAPEWTSIPYGKPLANQSVRVLDTQLRPRPVGVTGEIFIGGAGVARGYWRDPERTAARFVTDPESGEKLYRTGDLGRLSPSGDIEFLGRNDFQVKIQGYRVELGEIEAMLAQHPRIRACVIGASGERFEYKKLVAWIVATRATASESDEALFRELTAWLAARLPGYMVPSAFVRLEEIPLTSTGKVARQALPDPGHVQKSSRDHVPARTATERALVELWEALLDVENISITDRFADLGGHSLLAVQLVIRAKRRLGVELPLAAVFQHPTIEELAPLIDADGLRTTSLLVPLSPGTAGEPLFLIHPIGGSPMCYVELAREMSPVRRVMGVQALGLTRSGPRTESLEELAAHYAGAIAEHQPEGPLHLAGWSMGGCLAFEIARQLRAGGRSIALLALIDSDVPDGTAATDDVSLLAGFVGDLGGLAARELNLDIAALVHLDRDERVDHVLGVARAAGVIPVEIEREHFVPLVDLFASHWRALASWRPQAMDLPLHLFVPQSRRDKRSPGPELAWERCASSVQVHSIPGDHFSVVRNTGARAVAEVLHALERALQRPR
jgi:amino acid adenylation domain-containing protein